MTLKDVNTYLKAYYATDPITGWVLKELSPWDQMKVVRILKEQDAARECRRNQTKALTLKHRMRMRRFNNGM